MPTLSPINTDRITAEELDRAMLEEFSDNDDDDDADADADAGGSNEETQSDSLKDNNIFSSSSSSNNTDMTGPVHACLSSPQPPRGGAKRPRSLEENDISSSENEPSSNKQFKSASDIDATTATTQQKYSLLVQHMLERNVDPAMLERFLKKQQVLAQQKTESPEQESTALANSNNIATTCIMKENDSPRNAALPSLPNTTTTTTTTVGNTTSNAATSHETHIKLMEEKAQLQQEVDTRTGLILSILSRNATLEDEVATLQAKDKDHCQMLQGLNVSYQKTQTENVQLQNRIQELEQHLQKVNSSTQQLLHQVKNTQQEEQQELQQTFIQKLQQGIVKRDELIVNFKKSWKEAKEKVHGMIEERNTVQQKYEELKQKAREYSRETQKGLRTLQQQRDELQHQLDTYQWQQNTLKDQRQQEEEPQSQHPIRQMELADFMSFASGRTF